MVIDLQRLSLEEREAILLEAGPILRHVPFPDIHPDRASSKFYYEVVCEDDLLQMARRSKVQSQTR